MLTNINRVVIAVMVCVFACPGQAQDLSTLPKPLAEMVEAAQKACAVFETGVFALVWGAVNRVDLDGDLRPDWVLNDSAFACSSAASLYCGTGGCESHFLVGDTVISLLNQGWDVVTFGQNRVLLVDVHGSEIESITEYSQIFPPLYLHFSPLFPPLPCIIH